MTSSNKPVIIHIVNSNIYSGLEKVVIEIIKRFDKEFDFYYACQDGPIEDVLKEKNIKRIRINKISKREINKIEKKYNPCIMHAHDYKATVFCGLFSQKAKVISHLHNNSPWIKQLFHPYTWLFLLSSFRVFKILTVSDSIQDEYVFSKLIERKIKNISNPVSSKNIIQNLENAVPNKIYDICFTGRLTEQKNPLKFIKIVNELKKEKENLRVIMIGDGELKNDCMELIKKLDLDKNIELLGFLKNPYEEMNRAKVFCLTSDWEGFGLVAFEAISLGLPAVVSNVGGLPYIVDNYCGKLCDNEKDFYNEILKLLNDNAEYEKKSQKAKEKARMLDNIDTYMDSIKKIYKEIIL